MAETQVEGSSIFRQSAMSRISNADDLDKYIKVANPSAWIVLLAAIFLLGALAIWSATAQIPTNITATGIAQGGKVICWVDESTANKIEAGKVRVLVNDVEGSDLQVTHIPQSAAEIKNGLESQYLADTLTLSDWNYEFGFSVKSDATSGENPRLVPVDITVSEDHPLDLVLGQR